MKSGERDRLKIGPDGTSMPDEFRVPVRGRISSIGLPDELGNVYAVDRNGRPYIAYNTRGFKPGGTPPDGFPQARANIISQGGSLIEPESGKKRLRDYYKSLMGAEV
jgi:hypothetical protein